MRQWFMRPQAERCAGGNILAMRCRFAIDLQEFGGHADPRTTLTYIRSRDRLSKSPAYVLNY
jgi:hypothetical protein